MAVLAATGIYFSAGFYSVAADGRHWRPTERVLEWIRLRAFGGSHDEAAIWSLVDFLDRLPDLAPRDYEALVKSAPREEAMPGGHAHGGDRATPHPEK